MPNGKKKWWQVILRGDPDWPVFSEWLREWRGASFISPLNIFNFRESNEYKFWVSQDKPTVEEWRARKEKERWG